LSVVDFSKAPDGHEFDISIEKSETDGERAVRLGKEVALFVAASRWLP
jgi:hypothetical protein